MRRSTRGVVLRDATAPRTRVQERRANRRVGRHERREAEPVGAGRRETPRRFGATPLRRAPTARARRGARRRDAHRIRRAREGGPISIRRRTSPPREDARDSPRRTRRRALRHASVSDAARRRRSASAEATGSIPAERMTEARGDAAANARARQRQRATRRRRQRRRRRRCRARRRRARRARWCCAGVTRLFRGYDGGETPRRPGRGRDGATRPRPRPPPPPRRSNRTSVLIRFPRRIPIVVRSLARRRWWRARATSSGGSRPSYGGDGGPRDAPAGSASPRASRSPPPRRACPRNLRLGGTPRPRGDGGGGAVKPIAERVGDGVVHGP